jgi:hypothetical protein
VAGVLSACRSIGSTIVRERAPLAVEKRGSAVSTGKLPDRSRSFVADPDDENSMLRSLRIADAN